MSPWPVSLQTYFSSGCALFVSTAICLTVQPKANLKSPSSHPTHTTAHLTVCRDPACKHQRIRSPSREPLPIRPSLLSPSPPQRLQGGLPRLKCQASLLSDLTASLTYSTDLCLLQGPVGEGDRPLTGSSIACLLLTFDFSNWGLLSHHQSTVLFPVPGLSECCLFCWDSLFYISPQWKVPYFLSSSCLFPCRGF